jgi:hypothetical protein
MALPQGINFRQTLAYVTDGANESWEGDGSAGPTIPTYPRTTAQGNTVGWESGAGVSVNARDRNSGNTARLAGCHFAADGTHVNNFRIDLPSAGNYNVRIASGDPSYARSSKVEMFDTSTSRGVLCNGSTGAANSFLDASGTVRTAATWAANNTSAAITFTTTICRFRVGAGSGSIGDSPIAHVYIESAGGATTPINVTPSIDSLAGGEIL